jgi:hypothetical protein
MENKKVIYTAEPSKNYNKSSLTIEFNEVDQEKIKSNIKEINSIAIEGLKDLITKVNEVNVEQLVPAIKVVEQVVPIPTPTPINSTPQVKPHYNAPPQSGFTQQAIYPPPQQPKQYSGYNSYAPQQDENQLITKENKPTIFITLTANKIIDEATLKTLTIVQAKDLLKNNGFR